jgi:hypothetical protein
MLYYINKANYGVCMDKKRICEKTFQLINKWVKKTNPYFSELNMNNTKYYFELK